VLSSDRLPCFTITAAISLAVSCASLLTASTATTLPTMLTLLPLHTAAVLRCEQAPTITVTRVSLTDPLYKHRLHWSTTVVPRLYAFANLVYSLRADDAARYSFLSSSRIEQLQLVASQCPHFAPLLQRELDAAAAAAAASAAAAAAEREAAETAAAVAAVATAEAAAGATSASAGSSGDAAAAAVLPRTPEPLRRTLSKQRSVAAAAAPATPGSSSSSVCIVSPPRGSAHNAVKSPRKGKGKGRAAATPQKKSPQKCVTDYFTVVSSKVTATAAGSISIASSSNSTADAASAGEQEAVLLAQELALEAFLSAKEEASRAAAAAAVAAQTNR
jgi:hypothetical protein